MRIFHGLPDTALDAESTLTIGVFDGVHTGHRRLIETALQSARQSNRLCGVVTFDPHPVAVLAPSVQILSLTNLAERARLIEQIGVDFLCIIHFTVETSQTRAPDFVRQLFERLMMRELVIGHDFTLGHKRQGNAAFLRALGNQWGFTVQVVEPFLLDGEVISSTRIRALLAGGQIEAAARLLGHDPAIYGTLTANLSFEPAPRQPLPADGLYRTRLRAGPAPHTSIETTARVRGQEIALDASESLAALAGSEAYLEFISPLPAYEEIEHTADVALRVRGQSLEELFCHAAEGMFSLMAGQTLGPSAPPCEIELEADDTVALLVGWLNELLYQSEMKNLLFRQFDVQLFNGRQLRGAASGSASRDIRKPIKAVTFHDLKIIQQGGWYEATIVFDV
ncbi:MAG: archease [Chloroflexi bacterium]|nr:archease [Chloroflexota bacterium]